MKRLRPPAIVGSLLLTSLATFSIVSPARLARADVEPLDSVTVRLMTLDADLIVIGRILAHRHIAGNGIDEYVVRPERSIKNLVFADFAIRAKRAPEGAPLKDNALSRKLAVGTVWYLFLVGNGDVFVPFAGDRGVLRLQNDRLYRVDGFASRYSPASLEEAVRRFQPAAYDPLLWSSLIVRGFVEECGTRQVSPEEVYPGRLDLAANYSPGTLLPVHFVRVRVIEALKGRVSDSTVELYNIRDNYCKVLPLEHEVLVCAGFNPFILRGSYTAGELTHVFGRDDGGWVPGVSRSPDPPPGAHDYRALPMTDAQVRARIAQGALPAVTGEADVIVVGDVVAVEDTVRAVRVTLRVETALKGIAPDTVTFLTGSGWRYGRVDSRLGPAPKVGERWVAFLRMGTKGYFAFAGCNGLLRADGERLIYGHADHALSLPELIAVVRENVAASR